MNGEAYTWTLVGLMTPTLGFRGARKSVAAMRAATTKATVVKKPKVFWMRTREECMVATGGVQAASSARLLDAL
jgi:phage gp16-like protein